MAYSLPNASGLTVIGTEETPGFTTIRFSDHSTVTIPHGRDGTNGKDGKDGITPHIGENGNWWIGEKDTGVSATSGGGGNPGTGNDCITVPGDDLGFPGDAETGADAEGTID